ncbi:hypothetical protein YPPY16_3244 [Yersinia pestis PY-16]|nr:hypothetical protein YPPY16_3244 [Yersinia pestis PY-16]
MISFFVVLHKKQNWPYYDFKLNCATFTLLEYKVKFFCLG